MTTERLAETFLEAMGKLPGLLQLHFQYFEDNYEDTSAGSPLDRAVKALREEIGQQGKAFSKKLYRNPQESIFVHRTRKGDKFQ